MPLLACDVACSSPARLAEPSRRRHESKRVWEKLAYRLSTEKPFACALCVFILGSCGGRRSGESETVDATRRGETRLRQT